MATSSVRRRPTRPVRQRHFFRPRLEALEARRVLSTLVALTDTGHLLTFDSSSPGTATDVAVSGLHLDSYSGTSDRLAAINRDLLKLALREEADRLPVGRKEWGICSLGARQ